MPDAGRRPRRAGCGSTTPTATAAAACCRWRSFLTKNAPGPADQPGEARLLGRPARAGRAHPAAARRTCPSCPHDEAKLGDLTAARGAGPAPRGHEPAPAATRGSTRSAWSSRATARSASGATKDLGGRPVDTRADVPRRQRGRRASTGLRALHPRAPRRTISSTTCAASCWPTPSAAACCCPTSRLIEEMRASWPPTATASAAWSRASSPAAVPEQARSRRAAPRSEPMT